MTAGGLAAAPTAAEGGARGWGVARGRSDALRAPAGARLVACALLGASGCGAADGTSGPAAPTETSLAELCGQLAAADCARLERCGFLGEGLDRAACEARQASVLCAPWARAFGRAEAGGEGTWLAGAGRRCVEAIGSGCERGFAYSLLDVPACQQAFQPRATEGERCSFVGSCVEGTFCDARAACPGTCRPLGAVNQPCNPSSPCAPGLYCSLTQMVCLPPSDVGAACETPALGPSCRAGAFCDGSQGQPTCVPARGRGNGCTSAAECAAGLRCLRNRCSAGELDDSCEADADCAGQLRCVGGGCAEPGGVGAPCGAAAACARGLVCAAGACAVGLEDGASCGGDVPCASGRCVDGACAPRAADGESCADAADCLEGRSCVEGACRARGPFCPV